MDWFWTWGGESFGFRRGDRLFTYQGVQAGQFRGDEVYGSDGQYLGEIRNERRLITKLSKKGLTKSPFVPAAGTPQTPYVTHVGNIMYSGFEDFPGPETFR